jgi:hypothetical protein
VFPVLCSGFLWADGCADSDYCEVRSDSSFLSLFLRFWFSVFLLLLAVIDYLVMVLVLSFVLISAISIL